ncbi:MAG: hypothetical protein ABFS22_12305 [Pseudomonadota bacterium]
MRGLTNGLLLLLLMAVLTAGHANTDAYVGAVYHAHIKRDGGKLVADEFAATGYRWDDYDIVEVKARTQRIPAWTGHGLQLIAVFYNLPLEARVDVDLVRPGAGIHRKRGKLLQYSKLRNVHFFEYIFFLDEEKDLEPGHWEIRVWHEGRIMLREQFEIYADAGCILEEC